MSKLKLPQDFFHHHLKGLCSAEKQLTNALFKMKYETNSSNLNNAFKECEVETAEI